MSDDIMTIRQMCDTFNVTPRALRFYEAKELITPIREGQKRLYTKRDRARLKLLLRGKKFGFSLEDIRQLLNLYDADDRSLMQLRTVTDAARTRLAELQHQHDELGRTITELGTHIAWGDAQISNLSTSSAA